MTHIAFFGHDAADSAVRRRVRAMNKDQLHVTGFMMRRRSNVNIEWPNVDLGLTQDGAFLSRLGSIFSGARKASKHPKLKDADVIYARNLDMLAAAFLAKKLAGLKTPVIYECLDIHRLMIKNGIVGAGLRWIEGKFMSRSCGLITSSPGFLRNYFDIYHNNNCPTFLVENRLAAGSDYGVRPAAPKLGVSGKLRLGWVGMLRCKRSLDLLCLLADRFPEKLEIKIHGIPARTEIPVFEPEIEKRSNMSFGGRYQSPEDLSRIYANIDVVWAGDFMDAGYNSVWLLPNRIYEGGYYGVPAIAPANTETGNWIQERASGFTPKEPLEETFVDLIAELIDEPGGLNNASRALLDLPEDAFVEPAGVIRNIIQQCLTNL